MYLSIQVLQQWKIWKIKIVVVIAKKNNLLTPTTIECVAKLWPWEHNYITIHSNRNTLISRAQILPFVQIFRTKKNRLNDGLFYCSVWVTKWSATLRYLWDAYSMKMAPGCHSSSFSMGSNFVKRCFPWSSSLNCPLNSSQLHYCVNARVYRVCKWKTKRICEIFRMIWRQEELKKLNFKLRVLLFHLYDKQFVQAAVLFNYCLFAYRVAKF